MAAGDEQTDAPRWQARFAARLLDPAAPYVLVRFVLLRLLGLVYLVAFSVAARQGVPLLGQHGLLPVPQFLARVLQASGSLRDAWLSMPTLFWLGDSDSAWRIVAWLGIALSMLVLLGVTNALVQLALWVLYLSIVQVGQRFYGYGWEMQLLETGMLAVFACPLRSLRPFASPPPPVCIWLFRLLIWRVMLGSGLIKIRGDTCWRDLTCLMSHYETQPIPNPFSAFFHHAPAWLLRAGVLVNHVVELAVPWFAFGPRRARLIAGCLLVGFQLTLIASGNLSFLNWLTIVPALACFDDAALRRCVPARWRTRVPEATAPCSAAQQRLALAYAAVVSVLSVNPVSNLVSPQQAMNRSFDRLHLVNTYGAFGSVGRVRHEVILEGTRSERPDAQADWRAYELPCKPGDVRRRPCWISPYHLRLDWQLWFAALSDPAREPWIVHLVYQLLTGDADVTQLFALDPFAGKPPRFVRAELYRYQLAGPFEDVVWHRTRVGSYIRPVGRDDPELRDFLMSHGWLER